MSTERVPINVILRGEQSGRQITVLDNVVSADFQGPPLHHHDFDETFYVLEGELTDVRKGGRGRASLEAMEPWPEVITIGPRIGERLGRP